MYVSVDILSEIALDLVMIATSCPGIHPLIITWVGASFAQESGKSAVVLSFVEIVFE